MSSTYAAVDDSRDPVEARDWQERIDAWPQVRAYKEHSYRSLPEDGLVLDVGCGPGGDLVQYAAPRSCGVDSSSVMCRRARERCPRVCRAMATALPFATGVFAGVRADRVVQHLEEPALALDELVRVARPGGRVVVADPDQESLVIVVPSVPTELTDQIKQLRRDVGYRNGRLSSRLPEWFHRRGLVDVDVAAFPLLLTDPADAFGLPAWPRLWRERGLLEWTDTQLERWDAALAGAQTAGFIYALTYVVTSGTKPPAA